jgi:hypothetical protein
MDEVNHISEPTPVMPSELVYHQDKAVIDTQIATAKHYPRSVERSIQNAMAIVTLDQATAASCTYTLPRSGKQITGPSVHLAKIIAQNWGNLRVEAKVIAIEMKQITSQAIAFDLENNVAIKVEVKRSIMSKSGRFNDDMITVTGNAANAIAMRNAILAVIPRGVVDKVWEASKRALLGDLSDSDKLIASRKKIFDEFANTFGVNSAELLALVGKPDITNVTQDNLVFLLGVRQALIDGDANVDETFKRKRNVDENGKTKEDKVAEAVKSGLAKGKMTSAK